jgi:hypothetical protein
MAKSFELLVSKLAGESLEGGLVDMVWGHVQGADFIIERRYGHLVPAFTILEFDNIFSRQQVSIVGARPKEWRSFPPGWHCHRQWENYKKE